MTERTFNLTDGEFNDQLLDSLDNIKWFVKARNSRNAFMSDRCCAACGKAIKSDNGTRITLIDEVIELGPKCSRFLKTITD